MRYTTLLLYVMFGLLPPLALGQPKQNPSVVLNADFAKTRPAEIMAPVTLTPSSLTDVPDERAGGSRSLKVDTRGGSNEWNEFLCTRPGLLRASVAYTVAFDYRLLPAGHQAQPYALFRRPAPNAATVAAFTLLPGAPGEERHAELALPASDNGDFTLVLGLRNQGAMTVNHLVIRTDPAHTPPDVRLPRPARTWRSPGGVTYYVDSAHGNDHATGRSRGQAWRSLARVNGGTFGPGDRILLRAGSRWAGFLSPGGSGAPGRPAIVDRYGDGPSPRIDGEEKTLATVLLRNAQHWTIRNLEITNQGPVAVDRLAGMELLLEEFGEAREITLSGLYIHDVTGSNEANPKGGGAIRILRGETGKPSRYNGLRIENCRLSHVDRNGILMDGNVWRTHWYPNLGVVIRRNRLEDIGGDGIVPIACDGALVEHNIVRGARMRTDSYAVGIYPWSCDNTVIQFNEVSGVKGTKDGQGYDCDFNCRNTLMQYNYSHDNEGGFMLVCNNGEFKAPMSAGNQGSIIRYNVSVNDGNHLFTLNGPCTNTRIYNNVVYVGKPGAAYMLACGNWGGAWASDVRFENNVFYAAPGVRPAFDLGGMRDVVFDGNLFFGDFPGRPQDAHASLADPLFARAGGAAPSDYAPRPGSPCLAGGVAVPDNGGRDFAGHAAPAHTPPTRGAFQLPAPR